MFRLMKQLLLLVIIAVIVGCGGGGSTSTVDNPSTYKPTVSKVPVVFSNDGWDRDNYTLYVLAKKISGINLIGVLNVMDDMGSIVEKLGIPRDKISVLRQSNFAKRSAPIARTYDQILGIQNNEGSYQNWKEFTLDKLADIPDHSCVYLAGGQYVGLGNILSDDETRTLFVTKCKAAVLIGSWNGSGDANTRGAPAATDYVINHFPKEVKLLMSWGSDSKVRYPNSKIANKSLKAILDKGVYSEPNHTSGDEELLAIATRVDTLPKKQICLYSTNGLVKTMNGQCNQYIMYNAIPEDIIRRNHSLLYN